MEADFWHECWEKNQIGFHEKEFNSTLVHYFEELPIGQDARIFVPLCGKTRDIHWLLSRGFHVFGAELSEIAIIDLFKDLNITPKIIESGAMKQYQGDHIDIFVGDFFKLEPQQIGKIDAVYDRGAFVALPDDMRQNYSTHLMAITQKAPQLLLALEYDISLYQGPPFHISQEEIEHHYGKNYNLALKNTVHLPDALRIPVDEKGWFLMPKTS
ncbi:thiopurine S-methyltransferase [Terasakiella sp. SH-1]|uniref:thiopurine S-methyltransferase n=1 Tax=Terasakiella sp. SH-1 TaxID=2560057 RepID=UPI001074071B|nr:thiopurine S-methyltransferase [Terasakiella sp. SH-1]